MLQKLIGSTVTKAKANVLSDLVDLICVMHMFASTAVSDLKFIFKKDLFSFTRINVF